MKGKAFPSFQPQLCLLRTLTWPRPSADECSLSGQAFVVAYATLSNGLHTPARNTRLVRYKSHSRPKLSLKLASIYFPTNKNLWMNGAKQFLRERKSPRVLTGGVRESEAISHFHVCD